MRPVATMAALNRVSDLSAELVKIGAPVSALNASSWLSPPALGIQIIDSSPLPVVVAMGEPLPLTLAHQAVVTPGGDPAEMRSATSPLAPGHDEPVAGNASSVPEGVATTAGAVITTPLATRMTGPEPRPPRRSRRVM